METRAHNRRIWDQVCATDPAFTKQFDRGTFKGTAVDPLYNVERMTEVLGPVGHAWGWTVVNEKLHEFGTGTDAQTIHTLTLRCWFEAADGNVRYVEHIGHTKAAYWTRPRRSGEAPRFVVDDEYAKKSLTDALSKVLSCLGASADVFMGQFDGNKYVHGAHEPPARPKHEQTPTDPGPSFPPYPYGPLAKPGGAVSFGASDWIDAALADVAIAQRREHLFTWWATNKEARHRLHKEQPALAGRLEALKELVRAKLTELTPTEDQWT